MTGTSVIISGLLEEISCLNEEVAKLKETLANERCNHDTFKKELSVSKKDVEIWIDKSGHRLGRFLLNPGYLHELLKFADNAREDLISKIEYLQNKEGDVSG